MRLSILIFCFIAFVQCRENKSEFVFVEFSDPQIKSIHDSVYYKQIPFSGMLIELSKTDTLMQVTYLNGIKDGYAKRWHSNKLLAEERLFRQGKKEGIHKGWWPNGNPQFEFAISNDEYQNEFKEWNEAGSLIKFFHYKNGHEEGSQQLWYNDGKVRANYVIKDGRRFGLLGTKNCVNVSDSVFNK